ncbi:Uncharacterised protein [Mycobacterium tuberculosis]|uniref:Uncharacterized protein n=1 Tax=Mycobacterium tuberculosis TaxID=1773 RepID=A0A0T9FEK3_MYCTX|nr:hypothetical protein CAB90_01348 [Mycobacterium tuberculosis]CFE80268.1 Uncharacterised protein [Mycobacterium tuberculosis]CKU17408.1 Uncharacterised protein [Mycobacterium tuberculosis]CNV47719.1 Uncharacterised protein [Mycobacterium tuberculosis]CNV63063.1 Uncharacterised protein [Mycobacterium tuberculosis]
MWLLRTAMFSARSDGEFMHVCQATMPSQRE